MHPSLPRHVFSIALFHMYFHVKYQSNATSDRYTDTFKQQKLITTVNGGKSNWMADGAGTHNSEVETQQKEMHTNHFAVFHQIVSTQVFTINEN